MTQNTKKTGLIISVVLIIESLLGFFAATTGSKIIFAIASLTLLLLFEHIFNYVQRSQITLMATFFKNHLVSQLMALGLPLFLLGLGWWGGHSLK